MITKDIDVNGEKFHLMLTEQVINHVNNLKSLYDAAYEDPESFEQVSAEISSTIQEISKSVEPKPGDMHLDNLIQQIIKTVNDKNEETNKQSQDKSVTRKTKKRTKKIKSKK
jgi:hypothetical protein